MMKTRIAAAVALSFLGFAAGAGSAPAEAAYSRYIPIKGYVWNDVNKNGKMDSREPRVSNKSVKLYNSRGVQVGYAKTDRNGRYVFPKVRTGRSYTVKTNRDNWTGTTIPLRSTSWTKFRGVQMRSTKSFYLSAYRSTAWASFGLYKTPVKPPVKTPPPVKTVEGTAARKLYTNNAAAIAWMDLLVDIYGFEVKKAEASVTSTAKARAESVMDGISIPSSVNPGTTVADNFAVNVPGSLMKLDNNTDAGDLSIRTVDKVFFIQGVKASDVATSLVNALEREGVNAATHTQVGVAVKGNYTVIYYVGTP